MPDFITRRRKIDSWLLLAVLVAVLAGLAMISSTSVVISFKNFDSNYYYAWQQTIHLGIGIVALIFFTLIDYRFWQKIAPWLLVAIIIMLLITFIPGIGYTVKGASRWIDLGFFKFQPSEIVKLLSILYFSAWLSAKKNDLKTIDKGFIPFAIILGVIGFLIFSQPDAGTALVLLGSIAIMYYVAGAPWLYLFYGATLGIIILVPLILSKAYRLQRVLVLFNPESDRLGAAYHINQALLAIGAGGLWGLGFGQSKQKFLYLPEPHTDSIFAIIMEELGFIRALLIIALLLFIILRGLKIGKYAPDDFGRLVAVGISAMIAIQVLVNISAMLGLIPLTGITLPFISYGGSSLITLLAAVGILLNISKFSTK